MVSRLHFPACARVVLLCGVLVLAACAPAPTATPLPTATLAPTEIPNPTETATPATPAKPEGIVSERLDRKKLATIPGTSQHEARLSAAEFAKANEGNEKAAGVTLLGIKTDRDFIQPQIRYWDEEKRIIAMAPEIIPTLLPVIATAGGNEQIVFDEKAQVFKWVREGKIMRFAVPYRHFAKGTYSWLTNTVAGLTWANADGAGRVLSLDPFWQEMSAGAADVSLNLNPKEQGRGGLADGRVYTYNEAGKIVGVSAMQYVRIPGSSAAVGGGMVGMVEAASADQIIIIRHAVKWETLSVEKAAKLEEEMLKAAVALTARADVTLKGSQLFVHPDLIYAASPTKEPSNSGFGIKEPGRR